SYTVKDCKVSRYALVSHRALANTWAQFEFSVRVLGAEGVRPLRYDWNFDDGQVATTDTAWVRHNYEHRTQDSLDSEFLVSVRIHDANADELTARDLLVIRNPAFETLAQKGIVLVMHELTPRFPELDASGVVHQRVRLWHQADGPVTLTRVRQRVQESGNGTPPSVREVEA